ncbi:DUF1214 domain-containing protein [Bradyrhizobium sp. 6(2017)]|uniref:DUF1214 domain-containing protein n=1 Tax=Bradyrhizobium sp. 6(2017) TaxID=1197460 RepID=UPI0013E1017C|nr:DUF1214 domain-containing protein [Bradyrhizobium sp. 6(2017)]QIG93140.1 DUF1254 domain-containing protein [Bradyrhizobium sp. 6(2017)]
MKTALVVALAMSCLAGVAVAQAPNRAGTPSDQEISDSWIYLFTRILVLRQQQLDFQEGFKWNELRHRKPGAVDWPNPNLDVAYSEAWVAVDETSCTIVTVPKIVDRYYTVQFLNGWDETLANINERLFPNKPDGEFAVCLRGANVTLPADVRRVDLPVKYARVLLRVELGDNWDDAVRLQHAFAFRATGSPKLPDIPKTPIFDLDKLPGVELFDYADIALDSEPDLNPGLEKQAADARAIGKAIKDQAERERVAKVVREQTYPEYAKFGNTIGHGVIYNGWARPAVVGNYNIDFIARTLVTFGGIWANVMPEVLYYRAGTDGTGATLSGNSSYTMTFPKGELPQSLAKYFWSVIAVDPVHYRVLPNPRERYLLNRETKPEYADDGSLTLYFAAEKPANAPDGNWLPTPKGSGYRLTFRFYGPIGGVANGTYFPPPLVKMQ